MDPGPREADRVEAETVSGRPDSLPERRCASIARWPISRNPSYSFHFQIRSSSRERFFQGTSPNPLSGDDERCAAEKKDDLRIVPHARPLGLGLMDVGLLIERLKAAHPDAACALEHRSPFELLIATILSAQTTDARVNMVTPGLFARYPDARAMGRAELADLEALVRSTGFFRNKSKSIRGASERLEREFDGVVPRTMDELLTLPGVARKTANVVLGVGHGVAEGVVVDTHVARVSRRLGLSRAGHPERIERELMKKLPRSEWIHFAHLLIFHGRRVCVARKPRCPECAVLDLCPSGPYFIAGKTPPWERKAALGPNGAARGAVRTAKRAVKKVARVANGASRAVKKATRAVKRSAGSGRGRR
jgi:endonuclease-3